MGHIREALILEQFTLYACQEGLWIRMKILGPNSTNLLIDGIQSFKKGAPCLGLLWTALAGMVWYLWKERNQRYKEQEKKPMEITARECIKDIIVLFKQSSYMNTINSSLKISIINSWLATTS